MLAWIITSAVLLVVCIGFEVYIIRMKRELRNIKQELRATTDKSYNRQISVDLQDKDLIAMTTQLNKKFGLSEAIEAGNREGGEEHS